MRISSFEGFALRKMFSEELSVSSSSFSSLLLVVENKYKNDIYFGFSFVYVLTTCEDLDFFLKLLVYVGISIIFL